jgi:hypothetical protein
MTSSFIYAPWVHDELMGDVTFDPKSGTIHIEGSHTHGQDGKCVREGGSVSELCSKCWYEDHNQPPERKVDKQTQCDRCNKELVQVYVDVSARQVDDEDEEEDDTVEIGVDLRRHVCTQEYATVYIDVDRAWADDPGYWDDEILEAALQANYGPDWTLETDVHSEEPAEIADVEVIG